MDTGSYIYFFLISGSINGISGNKITAIGDSTGKTFLSVVNHLDSNPDAGVVYFDTESITKSLLSDRDIDTSRVLVVNVVTIEEFRQSAQDCR